MLIALLINSAYAASDGKTYPDALFGVWGYSDNIPCNQGYVEYLPNGLEMSVGVFCDQIIAYEAEWWVTDGYLYEKVTKVITHHEGGPILAGDQSKDKILLLDNNMHKLEEKGQINTYIRLGSSNRN